MASADLTSGALLTLLCVIAPGLLISALLEQMLDPRPLPLWRRDRYDQALHVGLWLALFVLEFLQLHRPWLAMLVTNLLLLVLVVVSNVKYRALREPFIVQDFEYFIDMLKHPRLYLPFFGLWRLCLFIGLAIAALAFGIALEPSLSMRVGLSQTLSASLLLSLVAGVLLWLGMRAGTALQFKPLTDLQRHGLLASLWRYGVAQCGPKVSVETLSNLPRISTRTGNSTASLSLSENAPNIVLVQSESFFDPRLTYPQVKQSVLQHFDRLRASASFHGTLQVPVWGANTLRTEFSVLTGLAPESLGIDRFNPYLRLATSQTPSLARIYKQRGYKTICIHPFPASFYRRNQAFAAFGFDQFIDIAAFKTSTPDGPYISDAALAQEVSQLLTEAIEQPLFIFVITMENHGPLYLETLTPEDTQQWLSQDLPRGCDDLPKYLRHLGNADQMFASLSRSLTQTLRPGVLGVYGDHVPIMQNVYQRLGLPKKNTPYFVWRTDNKLENDQIWVQGTSKPLRQTAVDPLPAHELAALLCSLS